MTKFDLHPDNLPLSAAQLSVWLDLQLHPNDASYGIWRYAEIDGVVDVECLKAAIEHVTGSCDAFGMQVFGDVVRPGQRINAQRTIEISVVDFSALPNPQEAAQDWMKRDHNRVFNLWSDTLFRNAILILSANHIWWYQNYHHLMIDGFGIALTSSFVAEAYLAMKAGQLPKRRYISYVEYLNAESAYLQSRQLVADRQYWRNLYSEWPSPVTLSLRPPRTSLQREFRISNTWLSSDLLDKFYALAKSLDVNIGHVFFAAIVIYVHRITQSRDIPICMPVHGRESGSMLDMIGMCVNTLPLRFHLSPDDSIGDAIKQIGASITVALQHRRYRYEEIRKDLRLDVRELTPFRINANVIRTANTWTLGEHPMRVDVKSAGPVEDLTFVIFESRTNRAHFHFALFFNPLLYEQWEIERHSLYFRRVMEQITASPSEGLRNISLITAAERRKLLCAWNTTDEFREYQCFHQLVEEQALRTPNATALIFEDRKLMYAELNGRANQLAHYLGSLGVRPGEIVGLCLDRSIEMIVGFMGILKAGGAYLPLDPDLPASRLAFMVQDANARIIVSEAAHELMLPEHLARLVFLDANTADITQYPTTPPLAKVQPSDLAYVIYTSGSTGQPKGVLLQHDGLCNLSRAQAKIFGVAMQTRVLQFARAGFDASVSEIAMTLASGGTLILVDKQALLPAFLSETLYAQQINVVTLPPTVLPALRRRQFPALKTLVVAGEACPAELAQEWAGRCRFINAYGPTESTVCATTGEYSGSNVVSIGRPIPNMEVYILDERQEPVPVGVSGEIYIGGIGIARGYLNRPTLTVESFISHPFDKQGRLYRSGDLGRYLPDGNIEFLGRRDQQVKLRGFRVELGEIEAALLNCAGVVESAVIVRDIGTRKEIIAYVVMQGDCGNPESSAFKQFLRDKLPNYMIPSTVMLVEGIPRTSSGKLNRQALPLPDVIMQSNRPYIAPKTEMERFFARLWSQAIGVEQVSLHDNFFEIGGDSLACIEVIAAAWEAMKIDLPPHILYESENLEALAQKIDAVGTGSNWDAAGSCLPADG